MRHYKKNGIDNTYKSSKKLTRLGWLVLVGSCTFEKTTKDLILFYALLSTNK